MHRVFCIIITLYLACLCKQMSMPTTHLQSLISQENPCITFASQLKDCLHQYFICPNGTLGLGFLKRKSSNNELKPTESKI